jgi:nucleoside-diphosphate-sugar epimerase
VRLLFIGGTSFVGRHAVEHAVAAGHDVTVFHRGRTNADLLEGRIDHRLGDRRTGDYASLSTGETWDAVVDVSAYVPRAVQQLADVVVGRVGHCVHISSISAYDDEAITPDESSPLCADLADPTVEAVTGKTYGPLKAMCERAATARFGPEHTTIIRPTYVVGPWDTTDRFTYWVRRMARGGDVAVVHPHAPLQVIDGRDLGAFMVRCAVDATPGEFDGVGPWEPLADVLARAAVRGVGYRLVDVGGAALIAADVDLPLLSPEPIPDAFMSRLATGARAAGLTHRPLADTIADLRAWDRARGEPPLAAGPTPDEERDLFA